jgi:hypothetical protein
VSQPALSAKSLARQEDIKRNHRRFQQELDRKSAHPAADIRNETKCRCNPATAPKAPYLSCEIKHKPTKRIVVHHTAPKHCKIKDPTTGLVTEVADYYDCLEVWALHHASLPHSAM